MTVCTPGLKLSEPALSLSCSGSMDGKFWGLQGLLDEPPGHCLGWTQGKKVVSNSCCYFF